MTVITQSPSASPAREADTGRRPARGMAPTALRWIGRPLVRGALWLPLATAAAPAALVGAARAAAGWQRALAGMADVQRARARAAEGQEAPAGARAGAAAAEGAQRPKARRVFGYALLSLLPALVSFLLVALCAYSVYFGFLYPLRPDSIAAIGHPFTADPMFHATWGGPTLVGAWAAHATVGAAVWAGNLLLLHALCALQTRLARRLC
ncbi:sensor domain-containing protein [Streptomyces sp. NPDC050610]|uniref:sensor domain-containing protein n=1 Tax=Streptomyces sp. NPDC050610 TaxID=3157097 RepID=UPI003414DE71